MYELSLFMLKKYTLLRKCTEEEKLEQFFSNSFVLDDSG